MGRLPESWLRELYERVDLRQLVGSYVELSEKGGRLWGCCPFHHEKDPSFTVNLQQGFYHCFGCGKHGNAVGFVMEMERLGFREACSFLADRVGMELPETEDSAEQRQSRELARRIRDMNRDAAAFYVRSLAVPAGKAGAEYLEGRGVPAGIRKKYGLGFAPDAWHALRGFLARKGYSDREMISGGLVQEKNGSRYDAFRNRVMFPIISPQSEVIGFGGRVLDDSVPKYLNSPATPVFNKSRSLFNMNVVKELRHQGSLAEILLMEGYMDVIGAASYGVQNTCATLGTALTPEQCRLLSRYAGRVLICYDGDGAGIKAALRALGLLAEAGLEARVVYLPDGMDPDEYLRKYGRDGFLEQIQAALEPMAFRFRIVRKDADLATPAGRNRYAAACVELLRAEKNALVREEYARILHEETGYRLDAILEDVGAPPRERKAPVRPAASTSAPARAENFVTAVLAGRPDLSAALVVILKERDFDDPTNAKVFRYLKSNQDRRAQVSTEELIDMLGEAKPRQHLRWLLSGLERFGNDPDALEAMLTGSVAKLGQRRTQRDLDSLKAQLSRTSDPEETGRIRRRIQKLGRQLYDWKVQAQSGTQEVQTEQNSRR